MTRRRAMLATAWIGAVMFLVGGAWALLAPHSFFEVVARYPPYNEHLFHDLGAFQLGLAAAFLAAIDGRDGLGVALWAGAVGGTVHAGSHWVDAHLGGRATDPALVTLLALVLLGGLAAAESQRGSQPREIGR